MTAAFLYLVDKHDRWRVAFKIVGGLVLLCAVVVGGVAISGGRGNLWGVFAGLLLLACISPALTHLHIEAYWEKAIQGVIILLAVVAEGLRSRKALDHG